MLLKISADHDRSTSHIVPTWQDLDILQAINRVISQISDIM